jgi:hypothetical protein
MSHPKYRYRAVRYLERCIIARYSAHLSPTHTFICCHHYHHISEISDLFSPGDASTRKEATHHASSGTKFSIHCTPPVCLAEGEKKDNDIVCVNTKSRISQVSSSGFSHCEKVVHHWRKKIQTNQIKSGSMSILLDQQVTTQTQLYQEQ